MVGWILKWRGWNEFHGVNFNLFFSKIIYFHLIVQDFSVHAFATGFRFLLPNQETARELELKSERFSLRHGVISWLSISRRKLRAQTGYLHFPALSNDEQENRRAVRRNFPARFTSCRPDYITDICF